MTRVTVYAEAGVVGERRLEESDGAFLSSRWAYICEKAMREASSIATWTNSQPTPRLLDWPGAIAGDAVANPLKSPQFLDVDVDHVARVLTLITAHRLGWLDILQPRQPGALEHPAYRRRRDAYLLGDVLAGQPPAP